MEHFTDFDIIKEKIIKTDELLRKYSVAVKTNRELKEALLEISGKYAQTTADFTHMNLQIDRKNYQCEEKNKELKQLKKVCNELQNEYTSVKKMYNKEVHEHQNLQLKYQTICKQLDDCQAMVEQYKNIDIPAKINRRGSKKKSKPCDENLGDIENISSPDEESDFDERAKVLEKSLLEQPAATIPSKSIECPVNIYEVSSQNQHHNGREEINLTHVMEDKLKKILKEKEDLNQDWVKKVEILKSEWIRTKKALLSEITVLKSRLSQYEKSIIMPYDSTDPKVNNIEFCKNISLPIPTEFEMKDEVVKPSEVDYKIMKNNIYDPIEEMSDTEDEEIIKHSQETMDISISDIQGKENLSENTKPPDIKESILSLNEDSNCDNAEIFEILRQMRMYTLISPLPVLEADEIPHEKKSEKELCSHATEIKTKTVTNSHTEDELEKVNFNDKYVRRRKTKIRGLHKLLSIKRTKQQYWLNKSKLISRSKQQNRCIIRQKQVKNKDTEILNILTDKNKENGSLIDGIATLLSNFISDRLKSSRLKRRSTIGIDDTKNVLEINKMLMEKARELNTNLNDHASENSGTKTAPVEESVNMRDSLDKPPSECSFERSTSEVDTPLDSCYESLLSNPPSIEMVQQQFLKETRLHDEKIWIHDAENVLEINKILMEKARESNNNLRSHSSENSATETLSLEENVKMKDSFEKPSGECPSKRSTSEVESTLDSCYESLLSNPPSIEMMQQQCITKTICDHEKIEVDDTTSVLEINKRLMEKTRESNTNLRKSSENSATETPSLEENVKMKDSFEKPSSECPSKRNTSEVETPLDSCYESLLSNPPSIEMMQQQCIKKIILDYEKIEVDDTKNVLGINKMLMEKARESNTNQRNHASQRSDSEIASLEVSVKMKDSFEQPPSECPSERSTSEVGTPLNSWSENLLSNPPSIEMVQQQCIMETMLDDEKLKPEPQTCKAQPREPKNDERGVLFHSFELYCIDTSPLEENVLDNEKEPWNKSQEEMWFEYSCNEFNSIRETKAYSDPKKVSPIMEEEDSNSIIDFRDCGILNSTVSIFNQNDISDSMKLEVTENPVKTLSSDLIPDQFDVPQDSILIKDTFHSNKQLCHKTETNSDVQPSKVSGSYEENSIICLDTSKNENNLIPMKISHIHLENSRISIGMSRNENNLASIETSQINSELFNNGCDSERPIETKIRRSSRVRKPREITTSKYNLRNLSKKKRATFGEKSRSSRGPKKFKSNEILVSSDTDSDIEDISSSDSKMKGDEIKDVQNLSKTVNVISSPCELFHDAKISNHLIKKENTLTLPQEESDDIKFPVKSKKKVKTKRGSLMKRTIEVYEKRRRVISKNIAGGHLQNFNNDIIDKGKLNSTNKNSPNDPKYLSDQQDVNLEINWDKILQLTENGKSDSVTDDLCLEKFKMEAEKLSELLKNKTTATVETWHNVPNSSVHKKPSQNIPQKRLKKSVKTENYSLHNEELSNNVESEILGYSNNLEASSIKNRLQSLVNENSTKGNVNVLQQVILQHSNDPFNKKIVINPPSTPKTSGFKRPNNTKCVPVCPQSPPPQEKGVTYIEPVIIPLEKPPKLDPSKAHALFNKLITYSNEEKTLEEVARYFTNQDADYIAKLMLDQVIQDKDKPDAKQFQAPIMTDTQRVILGFMLKLQQMNVENLVDVFLKCSELALLQAKSLEEVNTITRIYVAICKSHRYIQRIRRMCCDAFYFMGDLVIPFFFIVLNSWIEVLPEEQNSVEFPLVKVLIQLVNLKACNIPGYNLLPLRDLLNKFYMYPKEPWNSDCFFKDLFHNYLKNPTRPNDFGILLYCKNNTSKWVHQKLMEVVKPILENITKDNFKAYVIILIGNIVGQFHPQQDNEHLASIRKWLKDILQGDIVEETVKKSLIYALRKIPLPKQKKVVLKKDNDSEGQIS